MEFSYQAVNPEGHTVSGHLGADSERAAFAQLQQRGLTPLQLVLEEQISSGVILSAQPKKVGPREKGLAIRELGTLLQAGVPLAEAVSSMAQSHAGSMLGTAFSRMHDTLRIGGALSKALRDSTLDWPDYLYQLTAAGEETGKLAHALASVADQMEYELRVREEMRNALIYPAILVISGILAVLLVFIVVVPKFAPLLKSSRAQIPEISVWVLKAGLFFNAYWPMLSILFGALLVASIVALRDRRIRDRLLEKLSRLPLVGQWLVDTELGRWSAILGTLLENRVPILAALVLAENSLYLRPVRLRLQVAYQEIRAGKKIADALAGTRLLQATGLNLVRVGERSGELPAMLRTLARLYESSGRQRMKQFLILIEPAAILLIGGVIGFVMVAIMLAITSISNISL